jgi:hypothetical protein
MNIEHWARVFDVASSIIAASQDVGGPQAITLALRMIDLFAEREDDEAGEEN